MKSITLTDGCLPIACFQERSHRPSRTVQVLRPTYSNASPFRSNCPRKNDGRHMAFGARPHRPWLEPRRAGVRALFTALAAPSIALPRTGASRHLRNREKSRPGRTLLTRSGPRHSITQWIGETGSRLNEIPTFDPRNVASQPMSVLGETAEDICSG